MGRSVTVGTFAPVPARGGVHIARLGSTRPPARSILPGDLNSLVRRIVYFASLDKHVYAVHAVDPSTGAEKWNHGGILSPTRFTVAGDMVYVGDTLSTMGTVHALDADDGAERWSASTLATPSSGNRDNGPVTAYDFVYIANENGVVALDAATGAAPD
ncbi:outer membrane protein assembly factor BamB family protein [Streptomyces johnsoniae]|uniref:PQQ-binding-like beta-propeller repeat protein n=1 Tax=Streptomyces johnsoniae TaxID=3075532 RepID=A0ABU2S553_9ACTN|nr:PQQ-binding-like beta-propeller repeat protein [Streptomyces sp. DSM 41886]MDT0443943.1 PQQ-binding-like beta-propeller repeat protein [Streptomyces sp. DSM 41886]